MTDEPMDWWDGTVTGLIEGEPEAVEVPIHEIPSEAWEKLKMRQTERSRHSIHLEPWRS